MITLSLTPEQVRFLSEIVSYWASDMDAATEDVVRDLSIDDPDMFLLLLEGMREQKEMVAHLQYKLSEALSGSAA